MNEFLRPLKNKKFDGFNFFRNDEGLMEVAGFHYHDPGENLEGSAMGDLYDIIIYLRHELFLTHEI